MAKKDAMRQNWWCGILQHSNCKIGRDVWGSFGKRWTTGESRDVYIIESFFLLESLVFSSIKFCHVAPGNKHPQVHNSDWKLWWSYRERKFRIQIICHETFEGLLWEKLNSESKHRPRKGTRTAQSPFLPFLMLQLMFSSCIHLLFMRQTSKAPKENLIESLRSNRKVPTEFPSFVKHSRRRTTFEE